MNKNYDRIKITVNVIFMFISLFLGYHIANDKTITENYNNLRETKEKLLKANAKEIKNNFIDEETVKCIKNKYNEPWNTDVPKFYAFDYKDGNYYFTYRDKSNREIKIDKLISNCENSGNILSKITNGRISKDFFKIVGDLIRNKSDFLLINIIEQNYLLISKDIKEEVYLEKAFIKQLVD